MKEKQLSNDENISLKIEKMQLIIQNIFNLNQNQKKNRINGENDSYIYSLIHHDSFEKFLTYINQSHISFSSCNQLIFETNSLLDENESSLIEYATFYGSIDIFQCL